MDEDRQYQTLVEDVNQTAAACHRDPNGILIVAVSKQQSFDAIQNVHRAGCFDFGENRIEEAKAKISLAPREIKWHFIGSLQRNKVAKMIGVFHMIHSVDSLELARKISQCSEVAGIKTEILLQVNTSGEETKHGFTPEECMASIEVLSALRGVKISGLMTMAPFIEDESIVRGCFSDLRDLKDRINGKLPLHSQLIHLSMGMSHDYRLAIAEGATILRIGTKIFC